MLRKFSVCASMSRRILFFSIYNKNDSENKQLQGGHIQVFYANRSSKKTFGWKWALDLIMIVCCRDRMINPFQIKCFVICLICLKRLIMTCKCPLSIIFAIIFIIHGGKYQKSFQSYMLKHNFFRALVQL